MTTMTMMTMMMMMMAMASGEGGVPSEGDFQADAAACGSQLEEGHHPGASGLTAAKLILKPLS